MLIADIIPGAPIDLNRDGNHKAKLQERLIFFFALKG
jgi:hypothetical protein